MPPPTTLQQITPRVIAQVLGIDPARADEFVTWVRGLIELGQTQPDLRIKYRGIIRGFFQEMVDRAPRPAAGRRDLEAPPGRGRGREAGRLQDHRHLLPAAGCGRRHDLELDSAALLHFATHPEDRHGCSRNPNCCRPPSRSCCASILRSPWGAR